MDPNNATTQTKKPKVLFADITTDDLKKRPIQVLLLVAFGVGFFMLLITPFVGIATMGDRSAPGMGMLKLALSIMYGSLGLLILYGLALGSITKTYSVGQNFFSLFRRGSLPNSSRIMMLLYSLSGYIAIEGVMLFIAGTLTVYKNSFAAYNEVLYNGTTTIIPFLYVLGLIQGYCYLKRLALDNVPVPPSTKVILTILPVALALARILGFF